MMIVLNLVSELGFIERAMPIPPGQPKYAGFLDSPKLILGKLTQQDARNSNEEVVSLGHP